MSNSKLVSYTKLSPNCTKPRRHRIDTITIHCMAGDLSVESCGAVFAAPGRKASSNYGIGSDGRIALYVDEANRSWCSGNAANDHRAVTIEVANTVAAHPWPVSEAAYKALIDLLADICRRNGIERLLWQGDKRLIGQVDRQNMTVHRWFQAKACPGDWLYSRHGQIAEEVNRRLLGKEEEEPDMTEKEVRAIIDGLSDEAAYKLYTKAVRHLAKQPEPEWSRREGAWEKAKETGITDGTRPQATVSRVEAVTLILRALETAARPNLMTMKDLARLRDSLANAGME